ncbi:hypothetical protein CROQUDRAFT_669985 [Cronartium quercuum f. sp. fusiforme G11]|uniref:Uncharacterized protein n=1 Tax=Cronartium quercuum f. sp. fusiforme G11 TaxID=708437 RepID=A0A9P6TE03_9BASI|nr:hypothetical protein CROQUDRAFT_669985 [Cronartium quercuum f. sp. fusiforme G11]
MAKIGALPPEIIFRVVEHLMSQSHVCGHHPAEDLVDTGTPPIDLGPGPGPGLVPVGPEVFAASLLQSAFGYFHHVATHDHGAVPNDLNHQTGTPPSNSQSDSESDSTPQPISTPVHNSVPSERAAGSNAQSPSFPRSPFGFDYSKMQPRTTDGSGSGSNPAPSDRDDPPNSPSAPRLCPHTLLNNSKKVRVACDRVTWPDGLPKDPLLPLTLVNRSFQQCAQEMLFKHVGLDDQWQAHLFLRSLKNSCTNPPLILDDVAMEKISVDVKGKGRALSDDKVAQSLRASRRPGKLGDLVQSLRFFWNGRVSMGRGGGSLICDIICNCQCLKSISLSTIFLRHCKEPLMQALESRTQIKDFEIGNVAPEHQKCLIWRYDEIIKRLFTKWDLLESAILVGLSGSSRKDMNKVITRLPTFRCTLTVLGLTYPDLAGPEMEVLLRGSRDTLQAFHLKMPTSKIDRRELYHVMKDCLGPKLEVLTLIIRVDWYPLKPKISIGSGASSIISDPTKSPFIIDTLLKAGALSNVKNMTLVGPLASSPFLHVLPDSIVKLAWDGCPNIRPAYLGKFLSSWRSRTRNSSGTGSDSQMGERERELPNLSCCSVGSDDMHWTSSERAAVKKALDDRNACFHGRPEPSIFTAGGFFGPHAHHHDHNDEDEDSQEDSDESDHSNSYDDDDDGNEDNDDDNDDDDDVDDRDPDTINDAILEAMGDAASSNDNNSFGFPAGGPFAFAVPFLPPGLDGRPARGHGPAGPSTNVRPRTSDPYADFNGRTRSSPFRFGRGSGPSHHTVSTSQNASSSTSNGGRSQQRATQHSGNVANANRNRGNRPNGSVRLPNAQTNTPSSSLSSGLFGPGFNFGNIFDKK